MKQKEQLAAQEQKLEELTLKIEDVETLLDDVSDAAYDLSLIHIWKEQLFGSNRLSERRRVFR